MATLMQLPHDGAMARCQKSMSLCLTLPSASARKYAALHVHTLRGLAALQCAEHGESACFAGIGHC